MPQADVSRDGPQVPASPPSRSRLCPSPCLCVAAPQVVASGPSKLIDTTVLSSVVKVGCDSAVAGAALTSCVSKETVKDVVADRLADDCAQVRSSIQTFQTFQVVKPCSSIQLHGAGVSTEALHKGLPFPTTGADAPLPCVAPFVSPIGRLQVQVTSRNLPKIPELDLMDSSIQEYVFIYLYIFISIQGIGKSEMVDTVWTSACYICPSRISCFSLPMNNYTRNMDI